MSEKEKRLLEVEADVYLVGEQPMFLTMAGGTFKGDGVEGTFRTDIGGSCLIIEFKSPEKRTVVMSAEAIVAAAMKQVVGPRGDDVSGARCGRFTGECPLLKEK